MPEARHRKREMFKNNIEISIYLHVRLCRGHTQCSHLGDEGRTGKDKRKAMCKSTDLHTKIAWLVPICIDIDTWKRWFAFFPGSLSPPFSRPHSLARFWFSVFGQIFIWCGIWHRFTHEKYFRFGFSCEITWRKYLNAISLNEQRKNRYIYRQFRVTLQNVAQRCKSIVSIQGANRHR